MANELSKTRDDLAAKVQKLAETAERLEQRASDAEQKLKRRDYEMGHERTQTDEAKRGRRSRRRTLNIELLQRRLDAEQARRAAAEQKLEQATLAAQSLSANVTPDAGPANGVSSVRLGRYLEFAVALGYDPAFDPAFDPLFALLHEEVRVAAAYADWQAKHMERVTARRCDLNQSLDEQAFTTGIATRWHLVDHPHRRLGILPTWSRVGLLFDAKSEKYLQTITTERINEMRTRMGPHL